MDPTQRCCYPVPCANVSENAMSNTRNIGLNHCIAGPSSSLVVSLSMAKSSSISLSESASKVINYINGIIMGCTLHGMGGYFKSWCQTNRPCSSSNFFKVLGDSMVGIAWGCAVLKPSDCLESGHPEKPSFSDSYNKPNDNYPITSSN